MDCKVIFFLKHIHISFHTSDNENQPFYLMNDMFVTVRIRNVFRNLSPNFLRCLSKVYIGYI